MTEAKADNPINTALLLAKSTIANLGYFVDGEENRAQISTTMQHIDNALTMESPEMLPESGGANRLSIKQVEGMISDAYEEGKEHWQNNVIECLRDLPEKIKEKSLQIAKDTTEAEKLRTEIARCKNQAMALILEIKEEGKPKFTNDKARNTAQESLLRDDGTYLAACDELGLLESQLKREEIELAYSQNLFRAYLAIAGMRGVR